ncbi:ATP-binding protein [Marinobacterium stanieri]|uniref:ATP-binding protein n=1 Tax=Marinobacterium stanieri TaxID=49186 RepID=UPI001111C134|nr:ATP-binding protein [Marinobacterium stanieri]
MEALIRREKILSESKVREVFTPFSPIKKSELLSGREKEISSILSSINTPGQHALIYGNRGIGKSSLANVISEIVKDSLGYSVHKKKCSSQDTFNTLFTEILEAYGHNTNHAEITKEHSESSGASLSLPLFGGNLRSNKKALSRLITI